MAKRKNGKKLEPKQPWLADETLESVVAVAAFLGAVIFTLARFGLAGKVGAWILSGFTFLLGGAYFLLPLVLLMMSAALIFSFHETALKAPIAGSVILLLAGLGLSDILFHNRAGGFIGEYAAKPFVFLFDKLVAGLIFGGVIVIAGMVIFNSSIKHFVMWTRERRKARAEAALAAASAPAMALPVAAATLEKVERLEQKIDHDIDELEAEQPTPSAPRPAKKEEKGKSISPEMMQKLRASAANYKLPPLNLLESDKGKPSGGDIKANANIIQRTLQDFGIPVEIADVNIGPSVTQYALKPAQGIRLSRIVALQNDLALALAAHPLRIEAPIPGKSFVGIEVPNKSVSLVGLRSLLDQESYQRGGPLTFALGKDVSGHSLFADLARMPHLLIAGSTGSGKSVAIHTILMSLLYKNTPLSLRFIMIDPKRVELSYYQDIPHLLSPVVTAPKEAISALRWSVQEMTKRYEALQHAGARDIVSYNSSRTSPEDFMPYIVIVIDELADLMMSFGREVEASIVRIAQMARAVGIHLVLSTQRPSVEVITGLIKANITSRIAFQVASQIDSRTILDMAGAEKLLGSGDMLYLAADSGKPKRIQGGFVSESEVRKVTEFVRSQDMEVVYNEEVLATKASGSNGGGGDGEEEEDDMADEAEALVRQTGKASATFFQRKLRVGYSRASRLLDILEKRGVVGPGDGAKPREVYGVKPNDVFDEGFGE